MANRQQRRAANKARPAYMRKPQDQLIKSIVQNGITLADLEKNYNIGYNDGFRAAGEPVVRGAYAAICLALNDLYGFGSKRCCDVLKAVDAHLLYSLSSTEEIEKVWERMKLRLDFKEPFDRVDMIGN